MESKHGTIPDKTLMELMTYAEALEMMEDGDLAGLGDLLSQKFKSVEWELEGCPTMAKNVQIADRQRGGLTSPSEVLLAEKGELYDEKLKKARTR